MYFVFTFVRVVAISNLQILHLLYIIRIQNGCTIEVMRVVRTVPARDMVPGYGRRGE